MKVPIEKPVTAEELVHYGIKGMRWGHRKREETVTGEPTKPKAEVVDERSFRQRHKKALIGAGVVGGLLLTYGTYKLVDSGQAHQFMASGREFLTGEPAHWKTNPFLSERMDADRIMKDVVRPINPGYGDLGTKMNCRRCTFAYEMRRRGMDVRATRSIGGTGQNAPGFLNATTPGSHLGTSLPSMWVNLMRKGLESPLGIASRHATGVEPILDANSRWAKSYSPAKKAQLIFEALGEHPDRARGELGISWKFGGHHSLAWEIIGGKPVIIDTQSGRIYRDAIKFAEDMGDAISEAGATRLDNLRLNDNFLRRWIQNA